MNWISVKNDLPKIGEDVLCFDQHGKIFIGSYLGANYKNGVSAFTDSARGYGRGVTHWMNLPKNP